MTSWLCDAIDLDDGVLNGTGAFLFSVQSTDPCLLVDLNDGVLQAIVCDGPLAENLCTLNHGSKCFELKYKDGSTTDES